MMGVLCYGLRERCYSYLFYFCPKMTFLLQRKTQGDEYRLEVRHHCLFSFPETDTEVTAMVCTFYPKFCFSLLYQLAYIVLWLLQ